MEKAQVNLVNYIVMCISEFAERINMTDKQSYDYLSHYGGINFIIENYEIEHTLGLEDTIDDLSLICRRNGGDLM
jgi:hypothetical protein